MHSTQSQRLSHRNMHIVFNLFYNLKHDLIVYHLIMQCPLSYIVFEDGPNSITETLAFIRLITMEMVVWNVHINWHGFQVVEQTIAPILATTTISSSIRPYNNVAPLIKNLTDINWCLTDLANRCLTDVNWYYISYSTYPVLNILNQQLVSINR